MKTLSDEQLKAYFLGKLPESEAEILETECALSAELTGQAQLVERELADDFLRGDLSPADANLFETNYLITDARRKKLYVAQGLRTIAGEQKAARSFAAPASANSFWQSVFGKRHGFQLVFGGLFLLFVFGAIVFYLLTLTIGKDEVAEVKDVNQPAPKIENPVAQKDEADHQDSKISSTNSVVQNKEANKNPISIQKTQPEEKPVRAPKNSEQTASVFATFTLLPGMLRDEGEQSISFAPIVKNIKLNLKLPEEALKYQKYRAVLKTADLAEIFTAPDLKSFVFTIPAEKLENQTYIIFLEGQNARKEFESITEYTFRVRR